MNCYFIDRYDDKYITFYCPNCLYETKKPAYHIVKNEHFIVRKEGDSIIINLHCINKHIKLIVGYQSKWGVYY